LICVKNQIKFKIYLLVVALEACFASEYIVVDTNTKVQRYKLWLCIQYFLSHRCVYHHITRNRVAYKFSNKVIWYRIWYTNASLYQPKTFPRLSVIRAPQTNEGMRKVTRQPDGQPIETRPGFFLYKMGQNLLTRIGSDATTKIVGTEFQVSPQLSSWIF